MDTGVQRILITGGATGIGQATALIAAKKGYAVAINYAHSDQAAHEVVLQIEAMGHAAMAIKADIADEEEVLGMFETIDHELGPINTLVNNAAHVERQMRLDQMSHTRIAKTFSTNVRSSSDPHEESWNPSGGRACHHLACVERGHVCDRGDPRRFRGKMSMPTFLTPAYLDRVNQLV